MSRSSLAALLLGLTLLAGCEGPQAPPAAHVPLPPMPEPRRFPVQLGTATTSLDAAPKMETGTDPTQVVNTSEAKTLNSLVASSDGKTDLMLSGPTYSGEPFEWSDYRGKVVIVLFWASWHPACREDLTKLEEVQKFYRYRPLEVVAVNLDRDIEAAKKFLAVAQPAFPVIMDGMQKFELARNYPTRTIPIAVCVDKLGKIRPANLQEPRVNECIEELLQEKYAGPVAKTTIPKKNELAAKTPKKAGGSATASRKADKRADASGSDDGTLVEAQAGVGKKGQGYGGGIYTEPLKARWTTEQKLIFDVQIPKAMSLYQATHDQFPASHEEFMKEIIEENSIELPELPAGQEYVYMPEKGKLMVRQPKK